MYSVMHFLTEINYRNSSARLNNPMLAVSYVHALFKIFHIRPVVDMRVRMSLPNIRSELVINDQEKKERLTWRFVVCLHGMMFININT